MCGRLWKATSVAGPLALEALFSSRRTMISTLALTLLPITSCTADNPLVASTDDVHAASAVANAHEVTDLAIVDSSPPTLTVSWTQVDDGTGEPAKYRVKYAAPPIDWEEAATACTIDGDAIGAELSCEVTGLAPSTTYDVQLMSYRTVDGVWQGAVYSNVATGETGAALGSETADPPGIWIGPTEIAALPTSGAAWDRMVTDAGRDWGSADISNQDSHHDVYTLAGALVCARTGEYCAKARQGVLDAIGTEDDARWLAVGRNLGAYVIAADVLGLRADGTPDSPGTRVEEWMEGWLTKQLKDNNDGTTLRRFGPFHSGANAAAQEGFVYAAVAAYLRDDWALQRAWDAFRTFACDPGAPDREGISLGHAVRDGWAHDDASPCAVNPAGTTKEVPEGSPGAGTVHRIDGALVGDMKRGGTYQWAPGYTSYPWVGLEGFVPAAVVLTRAGHPAFEVGDRAVLRAHEYLWYLRTETGDERWFDGMRARQIVHLVNVVYGTSFPVDDVTGYGRTVGYTDWTHPRW